MNSSNKDTSARCRAQLQSVCGSYWTTEVSVVRRRHAALCLVDSRTYIECYTLGNHQLVKLVIHSNVRDDASSYMKHTQDMINRTVR